MTAAHPRPATPRHGTAAPAGTRSSTTRSPAAPSAATRYGSTRSVPAAPVLPVTGPPPASDAPRGLVLHVLLSDDAAQVTGTDLVEVAELLRETAEELLPAAATYTTLSLGPR